MNKIFAYELRRAVCNKGFAGIAVATLWYAWQLLNNTIILGVANTAPFSPWSFGAFLAWLGPLLSLALLLLLREQSKTALKCAALTRATPIEEGRYRLVKLAAAVCAWSLLALAATALGLIFLAAIFRADMEWGALAAVAALALLPPLFLWAGAAGLLGRIRPWLIFPLMALALVCGYIFMPLATDVYGATLFTAYPLTLGTTDPAFHPPMPALLAKLLYLILGVGCILLAIKKKGVSHLKKSSGR